MLCIGGGKMFLRRKDEEIDFEIYDPDAIGDMEEPMMTNQSEEVIEDFADIPTHNDSLPTSVNVSQTNQEILSITIAEYLDTGDIATYIKDRKTVIVNLKNLSKAETQRSLDYLSGVTYGVNGKIKKVSPDTYMMVPEHVKLTAET